MSFLDANFATFAQVLDSLDGFIAHTREKEGTRADEIDARHVEISQAEEAAKDLQERLVLPQKSTVELLRTELPKVEIDRRIPLANAVESLQLLYQVRDVSDQAQTAIQAANEASTLLSSDTTAAADLFSIKVAPVYTKLKVLMLSPDTDRVVSNIAMQVSDYIDVNIRAPIYTRAAEELEKVLEEAQWPVKEPKGAAFNSALQACLQADSDEPVLETMALLASQLGLRVRFNFGPEGGAFRADRPEWLFEYLFKLVDPHRDWLRNEIQPELTKRYPERVATNELISAILPSIFSTLKQYVDASRASPDGLAHVIEAALTFDHDLWSRYFYLPADKEANGNFENRWIGLTGTLLENNPDIFLEWLENEISDAEAAVTSVMTSNSAWNIDWDAVDPALTKPSISALNLKQLFETVTAKYRGIRVKNMQLQFISKIQLEIVERYQKEVSSKLAAFRTLPASLGRAVGQPKNKEKLDGMKGLEYASGLYASISFLIKFLDNQGLDTLFSGLYDGLVRSGDRKPESTIFDDVIKSLRKVNEKSEAAIVKIVGDSFQKSLKQYFALDWRMSREQLVEMSPALTGAAAKLASMTSYLQRLLSLEDLEPILSRISTSAADRLWSDIVQSNIFSVDGASQLSADIQQLWRLASLTPNESYKKLNAAVDLLAGKPSGATRLTNEEELSLQRRKAH